MRNKALVFFAFFLIIPIALTGISVAKHWKPEIKFFKIGAGSSGGTWYPQGAIIAEGGHWEEISKHNPAMMADFLRHHHAVGRLGTAEEIAAFAVFMASELVTFAQGSLIPVDGGTM